MTTTELEAYRQQLLDLGKRMERDLSGLADETLREGGGPARGNLSNTPVHPADLGSDNFEQDLTLSLMENEGQTLEEISAALDRVSKGAFGKCESCGRDIPPERLQAIPYARLCIDCARKEDSEPRG
jgi:RNA polymerase-binding transcription factor DksA